MLDKLKNSIRSWLWSSADPYFLQVMGGNKSHTGIDVTERSALQISAVHCAISCIAQPFSDVGLHTYKRTGQNREKAYDHPLYFLLHDEPNAEQSSLEFRNILIVHALLWGNGYAIIDRDGNGNPIAIRNVEPWRIRVWRDDKGQKWYIIDENQYVRPENILHLSGLVLDNSGVGIAPIRLAQESLGLNKALEIHMSAWLGNAVNPSVWITHPTTMTPENQEAFKKSIHEANTGVSKAGKVIVLTNGMKPERNTIDNVSGQYLEQRKFQLLEVGRLFRVSPNYLLDFERMTWNNIESQQLDFLNFTMRFWFVKFEQELNRKLFFKRERATYYIEHNIDSILRGDTLTRYQCYAIGKNWGFLCDNDIREKENLNTIDNGDTFLVPSNMTTIENILNPPQPIIHTQPLNNDNGQQQNNIARFRNEMQSLLAITRNGDGK